MRFFVKGLLLLISLFPIGKNVLAQTYTYAEGKQPAADKIIAVIGGQIILGSDLQKTILQQQEELGDLPPNASCAILEQMLAQNALVLQAEKDSVPVDDDRVEQALNQRIAYFEHLYGSREKMEEVIGMNIYQVKDKFRDDVREQLLAEAMQDQIIEEVKITPTEVKAYFDSIPKDSLTYYKSEVEVGQIVIKPEPDSSVVDYTLNRLNDFKSQALKGEKSFSSLANLYSDDLASGGDILTIDRTQQQFDPKFVAASFRLKEGEISPIIKTQFGYHIIELVSRKGNIARVRHILQMPSITSGDVKKATEKLVEIRKEITSGKFDFGQAASLYSDDDGYGNTKGTGGMFTNMQDGSSFMNIDDLDPDIVLALDTMKEGQISAPMTFNPDPRMRDQKSVRIIYLKSRSEPHQESLETDYSRIQNKALQKKQMEVMSDWFKNHVSDFYLLIDDDFGHCANIQEWIKASDRVQRETGAIAGHDE